MFREQSLSIVKAELNMYKCILWVKLSHSTLNTEANPAVEVRCSGNVHNVALYSYTRSDL